MNTTYTPETLAAEMECRATDFSEQCDRATLAYYALAVRALAQPTPEPVAPERRWEYRQFEGDEITVRLNDPGERWEFAAPPFTTDRASVTPLSESMFRTCAFLRRPVAEPAAPAAGTEAELVALRRATETVPDHSGNVVLLDGNGDAAIGSFNQRDNLWNIDGRFFGLNEWPYWMPALELPGGAE